ncbi:hypothetical protein ACIRSS_46540 [Amycolatopsis sp. NPDC101161]|uniref:hypothetical protein n=1 Tax=Amycolatopsis sp. NPDC101161 TaxID=3363940 RepID=UPI003812BA12
MSALLAAGALFVALAVLGGCYAHDKGWFGRKPPDRGVLAQMEAMRVQARIADVANAAEDHMDQFIRQRRQDGPVWPPTDVDHKDTRW